MRTLVQASLGSGRQAIRDGARFAPLHRSTLESSPGMATLSEEEARLLAALVQDYVQMKARELEQEEEQEAEGSR